MQGNSKPFRIEDIQESRKLISLYTGLQNYSVFCWIFDNVTERAKHMHYYQGNTSLRRSIATSGQKRGRKRKLSQANELFLTLVKLRLNLNEDDLVHRFCIAQSGVSTILSTWIPFLSRELAPLLHWPTQEENKNCYPKCFTKYPNVIGIVDCTEGGIEKPSLAKAQSQTYSSYKSKKYMEKADCDYP